MRSDLTPGGTFPDYELTDHTKTRRKLSELQGIDPMILVLARGQSDHALVVFGDRAQSRIGRAVGELAL